MSVDTLFNKVLALMFSDASDKAELADSFLNVLNIILAECFDAENGIREEEGRPLLAAPPYVADTQETIDYNWRLEPIMAYGVAGVLYSEDDITLATMYKNKYEADRSDLVKGFIRDVVDVYA